MSIFRETFEPFVKEELNRRQAGMLTRNPNFIHQLNSRSAWVRMTSGVNVIDSKGSISNELAKNYVLQGGILNVATATQDDKVTDIFALKSGLGGASNAYSNKTAGGATNRLGIKPMPGITNVSIQSKGAYGSLQEATISFVCWDIKQLEELELLYMRPGYTVLFEMGWDYAKAKGTLPRYDILNPAKTPLVLNEAFKEIHDLIEKSKGSYNALLGYVKNYNWSARDDGGYDCTTSIISLGEVLESLKCNWVPINTKAFNRSETGILGLTSSPLIPESYKQGIIPGLIREIYQYVKPGSNTGVIGANFKVPDNGISYDVFRKKVGSAKKNNRGGLAKNLSTGETNYEHYITLQSFCDLINKHVLLKDEKDNPLVQITTNEQAPNGTLTNIPLKCIASPLSLSTNLGVCYVENPNWESLEVQAPTQPVPIEAPVKAVTDTGVAINAGFFGYFKRSGSPQYYPDNIFKRFGGKIFKTVENPPIAAPTVGPNAAALTAGTLVAELFNEETYYNYSGDLKANLKTLADDLLNTIKTINVKEKSVTVNNVDTNVTSVNKFFVYEIVFEGGKTFEISDTSLNSIDFIKIFGAGDVEKIYEDLFLYRYNENGWAGYDAGIISFRNEDPFEDGDFSTTELFVPNPQTWDKPGVINAIKQALSAVPLNKTLQNILASQTPEIAQQVAEQAEQAGKGKASKKFLVPVIGNSQKQLGNIGNIYVNLEYLYDKAISRNLAANDNQTKNVISLRDYLQEILRDVQNSIGNLNTFDLQVDDRNSIGRIIDINSTQDPLNVKDELFTLQLHNLSSCVRQYNFQSKIFPEMGSIIAISAQDPAGIGTLGYDNATLVAWNQGISDRLIPKKLTSKNDLLSEENKVVTYILPFLTQMWRYFKTISNGSSEDDLNLVYGGLNFSFRDFLAHLDKENVGSNRFKTIIPTELSVTLDGIGGIIIGNLFKINEDVVPKGYRGGTSRKLAYIVTRLGHTITDNDWTTQINAYPIIFESSPGTEVWKQWNNQQYPGDATIIRVGGRGIGAIYSNQTEAYLEAVKNEPNFANKLKSVAQNIGVSESDLLTVMYKETAGTLDPSTTNSIGCVGLIQFCPDVSRGSIKTISGKQYTLSNLSQMTRDQQLDVVESYYKSLGFRSDKPRTLTDLYVATFYPAAIGKPSTYIVGSDNSISFQHKLAEQNPGIAKYSNVFVNGKKVINLDAVRAFIQS
jgi:hypothetical protein